MMGMEYDAIPPLHVAGARRPMRSGNSKRGKRTSGFCSIEPGDGLFQNLCLRARGSLDSWESVSSRGRRSGRVWCHPGFFRPDDAGQGAGDNRGALVRNTEACGERKQSGFRCSYINIKKINVDPRREKTNEPATLHGLPEIHRSNKWQVCIIFNKAAL